MKFKLLIVSMGFALFASAQSQHKSYLKDQVTYREHPLDITHMKVEVWFEPKQGLVTGKVDHSFTTLQETVDSFYFDAPAIEISSCTINGAVTKTKSNKNGVWIYPQKSLKWTQSGIIHIEYSCKPKRGIYFIGWNEPEAEKPDPFAVRQQIWTQGQGIDNRHWIPMYDDMNDKFTTETLIHFEAGYEVLSNGLLVKKSKDKDGKLSWHYKMSKPHAGYLLMIGIGKYGIATDKSTKRGVPLKYYYYPEFKERLAPTYRYTPAMIDFMEEYTGINYPWESYSQIMVQDFLYGAMENTTATVFGDFFNVDERAYLDRNYVGVNMHELTHQWFGDYITARDGRDTWLQESFATFFPKQFSRVTDGKEEWDWQRRANQNSAIEAGKKDNFAVRHSQGGTARVYPKGSAVISMLEYVLGEAQWKKVLNHYLKKHAYANVETNDLQQAVKDVLGLNLDWFFDQWIYRGGEPHYRVHYEDLTYQDGSRATEIAIEQIHTKSETVGDFQMPIVLEVVYQDGSKSSVKEVLSSDFEVVKIPNSAKKKIAYVLFDPGSNILKQLTFKKSFEELENQLEMAAEYLDRYDAAVQLRDIETEKKREVLIEALKREKHHGIVNELINQLSQDKDEQVQQLLQKTMSHPKSAVRENILAKTRKPEGAWKPLFEKALGDSSYDVVKTALEKLCRNYPAEAENFLKQTSTVEGMNKAVRLKWLELSVEFGSNEAAAKAELEKISSSAFEFRSRVASFQVLKNLNHFSEKVAENLLQACQSSNGRLAGPAAESLNHFCQQTKFRQVAEQAYRKLDSSQKEKVQKHFTLFNAL
ncbi:hypothetical protein MASR2M44_22200 [Bacteroidota bacterium]